MAVHGSAPFVHVEDSNGNPYVAALLYVYDVTTTTKKSIYSDTGLSVTLTNPLVSDASGNFSRFYMAAGTYKLRAETAAGVLIWQFDNIDTLLGSGSGALPVASGGTGATTAASARTNLSAAAQTDVDDLAADIATLSASLQNLVSVPQGYLTLTSGTAIITGDVLAATSVYYTPYIGNQIPIYDGTQFNLSSFSELTLTLNSNHTASNIYDVFVWLESGVVTMGTGPAWNTATAGAGARGSGAGTTELAAHEWSMDQQELHDHAERRDDLHRYGEQGNVCRLDLHGRDQRADYLSPDLWSVPQVRCLERLQSRPDHHARRR
jgi:hypothetical protein